MKCHENRRRLRHLSPPPATRLDDPLLPAAGLSGRKRELVILDDAGQYENQRGRAGGWFPCRERFPTLGEKRNAAAALVGDDVEALAVWDDDDLYLPWALSASAAALAQAAWSRPSLVLHPQADGGLAAAPHRRPVPRRLGLSSRAVPASAATRP